MTLKHTEILGLNRLSYWNMYVVELAIPTYEGIILCYYSPASLGCTHPSDMF